jgi:predicted RNA-binding protein associated with RNAse of E/G family
MRLKIRGIYTTALTRFFLDYGMAIVSPSDKTAERFEGAAGIEPCGEYDVSIRDLRSKQGISILGSREDLETVVGRMQETLWDAICSRKDPERAVFKIEFPYHSKILLDEIRNSVLPTVKHHHRFKIIDAEAVDGIEEKELVVCPHHREAISGRLANDLLLPGLGEGKEIRFEHRKLNARRFWLRSGTMEEIDSNNMIITVRRRLKGDGRYDGLEATMEEGDYDICRISDGSMAYTHTYYRRNGEFIGSYRNINTGIELYPDRVRYIDLELDVVHRPGEKEKILDQQAFYRYYRKGYFTQRLFDRVWEEAFRP